MAEPNFEEKLRLERLLRQAEQPTQQSNPLAPTGVGANFFDSLISRPAAPSSEQLPQQPTQEQPEEVTNQNEVDATEDIRSFLSSAGFRPDRNNIETFLRNNQDAATGDIPDFSDLKSADDPTFLDSVGEYLQRAIIGTSVNKILAGLVGILEPLAEGFQRWETAKVNLLEGDLGQIIPSIKGEGGKTEFEESGLRADERPELGDFFRKAGLPEFVSATGGLALDVLTDIVLFAGAGGVLAQLSKQGGKLATKLGVTQLAKEVAEKTGTKTSKEAARLFAKLTPEKQQFFQKQWLAFKSNSAVKAIKSVLKGETKSSALGIDVTNALRDTGGVNQYRVMQATRLGHLMKEAATQRSGNILKKFTEFPDEKILGTMNDALKGDVSALNVLSKDQQTLVNSARNLIDDSSKALREELSQVLNTLDADQLKKLNSRFNLSNQDSIESLINSIELNTGSYVKRSYMTFLDKNYRPTKELIDRAKTELAKDFDLDPTDAAKQIDNIVAQIGKGNEFDLKFGKQAFKVNDSSFIARQDIPPYIRDLLGEINDPIYNTMSSVRTISEATENFRLFGRLKELGLFSKTASAAKPVQIKGGPLHWGVIDGLYTTEDMGDLLKHIEKYGEVQDSRLVNAMSHLKGIKTIYNPKTHAHNAMGNLFFAILDGINPISQGKTYKEALEIISEPALKKAKRLDELNPMYKELVENGIIGTEFAGAGELQWLKKMIENPYAPKPHNIVKDSAQEVGKGLAELYAWEDQLFKVASYLHKRRVLKMSPVAARDEVFKWYPNYVEANRLAERGRSTAEGLFLLNPFITFRLEAHRILLNALKDPARRHKVIGMLGGVAGANTATLGIAGKSFEDIHQIFMSRPEALTEVIFNPNNPEADFNLKYVNPFETEGLFAPVMYAAGAEGVNPFDYLLGFTQFSPEFGYSNLIINAAEPLLTQKGSFGQDLTASKSVGESLKRLAPSSFGADIPKFFNKNKDAEDRQRAALRFLGIDIEERNPNYLKSQMSRIIRNKVAGGEALDSTVEAIKFLGFDADKIVSRAIKDLERGKLKPTGKNKNPDSLQKFLDSIGGTNNV